MKLFLASYKLQEPENQQKLVSLVGPIKKMAVIPNALDFSTEEERRRQSMQYEIDLMKSLGFDVEEIDLRNYFGKPDELAKKMSEFGSVWVRGGNTFVLRSAYKQSGFDDWLIGHKDSKEFVYAGYSAGVCVLQKDLKGTELVDPPNIYPEGYPKETLWNGVGFLDFAFVPHYNETPGHPETEDVKIEAEYYQREKIEWKPFADGEVLIMEI